MPEMLELTVDKFTFRVATDRSYSPEGVWVKQEPNGVRLGVSDFVQQRNGDVAFAEVKSVGTGLKPGDEIAVIETIKVDISLASPLSGRVIEINPAMETAPEAINQDPYGAGWLALIEATSWAGEQAGLLDPQAYFARMKTAAEQEVRKG